MRPGRLKLLGGVQMRPRVLAVGLERGLGPSGERGQGAVIGVEATEVLGQLPPDDQLLEKRIPIRNGSTNSIAHRQRNLLHGNLAEVQIGAQTGGALSARLVPRPSVGLQRPGDEPAQTRSSFPVSSVID